jgi:hypothetical protein
VTYGVFFALGVVLYGLAPSAAHAGALAVFVASFCVILSMYGGGFATVPAYLADLFGAQFVGAIHGRLLTAWATAGILGPVVVNYIREAQIAAGVPRARVYDQTMYVLAGMLVVGFAANLLIRPVAQHWFVASSLGSAGEPASASHGIGRGRIDRLAMLAWSLVGIPIGWGVWITLSKALALFG